MKPEMVLVIVLLKSGKISRIFRPGLRLAALD